MDTFTMSHTTKDKPANFGGLSFVLAQKTFKAYKEKVLGNTYELSITFIGKKRMQTLNNAWRKKNYPTDILSFPYDKTTGEIFICQEIANKKAKDFDRTSQNYLKFLVIHGLVHLKGYDHGSRMENEEIKWRKMFSV